MFNQFSRARVQPFMVVGMILAPLLGGIPRVAHAVGGQLGLEFAIDAPWRLEPIVDEQSGHRRYGPIPIYVGFWDAIFDDNRTGEVAALAHFDPIHVGKLAKITVIESLSGASVGTRLIYPNELDVVERKTEISTKRREPPYEICHPSTGEHCDETLEISGTHDWHAVFWYTPVKPPQPGQNIRLEVRVDTFWQSQGGQRHRRTFVNRLVVHAGEAPLPRFSRDWLYGDLHYHSQMTDNEGESGYAYAAVIRALGAMGLDFVFATEHASDSTQILGDVSGLRESNGRVCVPGEPCHNSRPYSAKEARDLNSHRFAAAMGLLYGARGVDLQIQNELHTGGVVNYASRKVLPQIFMGEEVDVWPEMSKEERYDGYIRFGDELDYDWAGVNQGDWHCTRTDKHCQATFSEPNPRGTGTRFLVKDPQGAGCTIEEKFQEVKTNGISGAAIEAGAVAAVAHVCPLCGFAVGVALANNLDEGAVKTIASWYKAHAGDAIVDGSRQHMVYFPRGTGHDPHSWISSSTGTFGGGSRPIDDVIADVERGGMAFLAHPIANDPPGAPGPGMVPYSDVSLERAWRSKAILGLQFWNEDALADEGRDMDTVVSVEGPEAARIYRYLLPFNVNGNNSWKPKWSNKAFGGTVDGRLRTAELYHGAFTWDRYLRKGLDRSQTQYIYWLAAGEPRRWFMAGGSDAHGDLNFRREGRPRCIPGVVGDGTAWCDSPVSTTAIGRPRNLVMAGYSKRPGNKQVLAALAQGHFSITDGPALRIAIDRNRNGRIDNKDFQMGDVFHLYPGERIPLLVEWLSTKEFGPIQNVEVYLGTKDRTFATASTRVRFDPWGSLRPTFGPTYKPYFRDPSGALGVKVNGAPGLPTNVAFSGIGQFYLDPDEFSVSPDGGMFYLRVVVRSWAGGTTELLDPFPEHLAYSNPVWGVRFASCGEDNRSLDEDGDKLPDGCDPCPNRPGASRDDPACVQLPDPCPHGGEVAVDPDSPGKRGSCYRVVKALHLPDAVLPPPSPGAIAGHPGVQPSPGGPPPTPGGCAIATRPTRPPPDYHEPAVPAVALPGRVWVKGQYFCRNGAWRWVSAHWEHSH